MIIKEYEEACEYYMSQKDSLLSEKKLADTKNESLKKELLAKQEIDAKRILA